MQQDNYLKPTSKSTSEWLKKNKIKVLYLNLIEMLWHDLKQSIHAGKCERQSDVKHSLPVIANV